jgi:glycosyltransferase involved in cell wall biosynthesis
MQEPLNIISNSFKVDMVGGPNKVINNLIKGLDRINYPYVLNQPVRNYKYNYIQDSVRALIEISLRRTPAVIGPNIVVLPRDLPWFSRSLKKCIYLYPSQWCIDLWKTLGFDDCPMYPWPVGIDTQEFNIERDPVNITNVMIYLKRRDPILLNQAITIVKKNGLNPQVIIYGKYTESQYKQILAEAKFGIWIGSSESQGIGLQEALASGLPLLVCDVNSLFESSDKNDYRFPEKLRDFKPTSAPYFDDRCGIIINDLSKMEAAVHEILGNISNYRPRQFIIENLGLEKQAIELLSFFTILEKEHWQNFAKPFSKKESGQFRVLIGVNLIYSIFIFRRKTRTVFKLIRNKLNF